MGNMQSSLSHYFLRTYSVSHARLDVGTKSCVRFYSGPQVAPGFTEILSI